VQGQMGTYVLSIPGNYNPDTPYPVGFAFHGRGNTGPQCQTRDCLGFQSVMKDVAVLVYMTSLNGTGWEHVGAPNDEREINVAFFSAVRQKINDSYCVNDNRVFVAGTSSGASFTNILSCRFGDKLLAAAPVAGAASVQNCKGPVAALVIHGYKDSHVLFTEGEAERDFHLMQNHCTSTAVPPVSQIHASVVATPESHQCSSYQGCDPAFPVTWCEHSEGGYDGTTHGWPTFGGQQIWDFVKGL
jgi:polyhydroxybutyrate depolymerase